MAVLKILLLIVAYNPETGELESFVNPPPAYETMDDCYKVKGTLPKMIDGKKISAYCIDPTLTHSI